MHTVPLSSTPAPLAGLRVLVVDDDVDMLWLWRTMLEAHGADVSTAGAAPAARDLLARARFDVLVSDIQMPGESGYDLIRAVRQLPPQGGGATPALAITSFGNLYDRARSLAVGFQAHLAKDARPEELVATIARIAGR
jgi:CheY-like chemotaxis protein